MQRGKHTMKAILTVLAIAGAMAVQTHAQQLSSAGVYGAVVDAQGAVMPGARVTLTDVSRGQDRVALANEAGEYSFPLIPVGTYRLKVEQTGFRTFEQTGIVLEVNDNRKIDVVLQVGDIATKVEVAAAAAAVETANATLKSVVDSKRILELPLNGRNVASLTSINPGVVATGSSAGDSKNAAESITFSVNGSRQNTLKFTLDGGDNEDNLQNVNMPFP